jgi:hypothetical protein
MNEAKTLLGQQILERDDICLTRGGIPERFEL